VWKKSEVANTFTDIRDSVPLAKEQLDLMIRMICAFRRNDRQQQEEPPAGNNRMMWLDLGCGDGYLSRKLLEEFPDSQGMLIDFSEPMLEQARQRMATNKQWETRVHIRSGDLSQSSWLDLLNDIPQVDLIVSSFAIHHLTNDRKQQLYQEIFDCLSPGGIFLNLEHVASSDATVEGIFDGAFVDSMYKVHSGSKTYEECQRAVEYDLSVDDEANILVPVETQCEWLREIGFQHVDCYFKFLILALFGGVK